MKHKRKIENLIILSILAQLILIATGKINQILLLGTYFIQFIGIAYCLKEQKLVLSKAQKNMINFLIVFFAMVIFMVMFSIYRNETLTTTILVFINILVICIINFLDKEGRITKNILKYFFIFVIFLAIYGIVLRVFGSTPTTSTINGITRSRQFLKIGGLTFSQIVMGRAGESYGIASLTQNPNSLSYFLIYALIMNTVYAQVKKKKKILHIALYGIIVVGIILAGSRLAVLLIPVAYLIPKILFIKDKRKISIIILTMISVLILTVLLLTLMDISILENIDLNGRDLLWSNIPEIITNHMLTGEGVGSSILILEELLGVDKASMHNTYFVMISDFGLFLSLIIWVIIVLIVIKNIKELIKKEQNINKQQMVLAISIILIILIQGMSESTIFTLSVPNILFFYMLSTLIKIGGKNEES